MRQIINLLSGLIYGLAPLAVSTILGIAIYAALPNTKGIIILVILGLLSIWLGISIFKRVQIVGPIEFISAVHTTPELDNLEPGQDCETKRRSADEIVRLIENNENLFQEGSMRIFGDWFGAPYYNNHILESASFDSQLKKLTLNFKKGEKLEIYNPKHIFEATTFLKIVNADRIRLTWFYFGNTNKIENQYFLDYTLKNKKIITETNVDWYKPIFYVSLGDPALMIFDRIK